MENTSQELGIVDHVTIGPLPLESGEVLPQVTLTYERVGPSSAPVILVCHALTGNHRTVGTPSNPGWWSGLIGNRKTIDTSEFQVITFNVLGGCNGSTGPSSISPITNQPYRLSFPNITIRDMVHAQFFALQKLQIHKLHTIIGGSLGGMQALEWGLLYPAFMQRIVLLAVTPTLADYGIAYNHIAKQAITNDPLWLNGHYDVTIAIPGLAIARMIGMVTYRSAALFSERFNRGKTSEGYSVSNYLNYQGDKLSQRFDANSYLYLLQAMNSHDIGRDRGGWQKACQQFRCNLLAISYAHDLIYEPTRIQAFASQTPNCSYQHVETTYGHDGFLTEFEKWADGVHDFLTSI
ncbi:homoserine O-acetyltransferase MetX [Ornithinibacillus contaminans]|uniref:homoserine O-acetyltransferase MetX n=1 Tax=Ornithinibacillus contaminans TaxID=694055 RepID=UPI00064DDEF5|nr:homoserine O-acetyltransferase [Ornithinibacillus contaminans]